MKINSFENLKKEYKNIKIPEELDFVVKKSIKESKKIMKKQNNIKNSIKIATSTVAVLGLLVVGVNTSPTFAQSLSKTPVVGGIVKMITFKEYKIDEEKFNANIQIPQIEGLENKDLENSLNEKYLVENEKIYNECMEEMQSLEELGGGHIGVDSGYVIKTDNEKILSVGRYVVNTAASSSTIFKYDTIDKEKEILITLPSLFKDDSYVEVISENILDQMKKEMESNEDKVYWIERDKDISIDIFERISEEQNFYINPEGKLVITFDKYEVAPGYMGTLEFTIPTETISHVLMGNEYIQ